MMRTVDDWLFDACISLRGERESAHANKIIIVGLDEESYQLLGVPSQYISPKLASVIDFLNQQKVSAIGVDFLVPEYAEGFPGIAVGPEQAESPIGDTKPMYDAVQRGDNVVLIQRVTSQGVLRPLLGWWFSPSYGPDRLACVELSEDPDFIARKQRLLFDCPVGDGFLRCRHLSVGLLEHVQQAGSRLIEREDLVFAGARVPLDSNDAIAINFVGPPGSFRTIPFWRVLRQATSGEKHLTNDELDSLREAVVILGDVTRAGGDQHLTPYAHRFLSVRPRMMSGLMNGPEVHANVVATLWDQRYILPLPGALTIAIVWLTAVGLLIGLPKVGLGFGLCLTIVHHFAWKLMACFALYALDVRLDMATVLATGALAYLTVLLERWRWTRALLGTLKSRALVKALEFHRGEFLLRGQQRMVTVMFADIRGFSDYSRQHSAEAVVNMLNAYFTAIVPIIERHEGMIDQYAGDGIKVVFNAMDELPWHERHAVAAAVEMVECTHRLRQSFRHEHGFPDFRIGIGLFTGDVIVGAVGSPRRLDYTAIGDSVNAAARIESENKRLGSEILISSRTFAGLDPADRVRWSCASDGLQITVKGVGDLCVHRIDCATDESYAAQ